jgi:hypothetical protein
MATSASIGDVGNLITGIATAVLAVAAVVTAIFGLRTYSQQARENRGRWLVDLRSRFAFDPSIVTVREHLYNERCSPITDALRRKETARQRPDVPRLTEHEMKLLVALDDYLDYLNLVHVLIENGELGEDEAGAILTWYDEQPMKIPEIKQETERFFPSVLQLHGRFETRLSRIHGPSSRTSGPLGEA